MGQDHSVEAPPPPTYEELTRHLAGKFADKCFTQLEILCLKDNFKSLADQEGGVRYLKEETISRFLELPDILGASPVLFHSIAYIGAFPFLRDAPAVLGLEQMVIVITLMTERYRRVLAKGSADRMKLLFRSLAVYDRKLAEVASPTEERVMPAEDGVGQPQTPEERRHAAGFAVDEVGYGADEGVEYDDDDDDDDDLVMAAFESLDYVDVVRRAGGPPAAAHGATIPADNFHKLVMLLLLIAPLGERERLSGYSDRLVGEELQILRATAECVLGAFLNVEKSPGIKFENFKRIVPVCFPFLFDGLGALFSHFLFSKNLDFSRHKAKAQDEGAVLVQQGKGAGVGVGEGEDKPTKAIAAMPPDSLPQPLLQDNASIMNANIVSQLSFFIPGADIFRRLRLLYSGDDDGFSMGSFESKVFNWRAPTILLVRGRRVGDTPDGTQESTFAASLPPRRFPHGSGGAMSKGRAGGEGGGGGGGRGEEEEQQEEEDEDEDEEILTFGVYISQPWRHTHRECFGDESSMLFQLKPVHDVFRASALNRDYASFAKPSSSMPHPGVAFGCPPPGSASKTSVSRHPTGVVRLGAVSLFLDSSFEFGVFNHDHSSRGGAFAGSVTRRRDFQDRFGVESLEVWGCGGDEEARKQAEMWAWEAREAEARRRINIGKGDVEADRALLELAGLVGQNRSGGSMG